MNKLSNLLTAALLLCSHGLHAQEITAENIDAIIAERMSLVDRMSLTVDGTDHRIKEAQLRPTEEGLQVALISEDVVFVSLINALVEGADDDPILPSILDYPNENDLQYRGELPVVEIDGDGVVTVSGSVAAEGRTLKVTAVFSEASMSAGNVKIEVLEDRFVLSGTLGFAAYDTVKNAIVAHPDIKLLELTDAPGSVDDHVNVHTARLVRAAGLTTFVANGSTIASGAVDLFTAGVKRVVEPGAVIGVHSWCCSDDGTPVAQLPVDHPEHATQLAYFSEMLGPIDGPAFYFYTLHAAPAEDIYPMPIEDMKRLNLITSLR